eukprot:9753159-Lingulodinium_polyedra.AAC.1
MEQLADGYDLKRKPVCLPLSVRSYPPLFNTNPEYSLLSELPPFDMEVWVGRFPPGVWGGRVRRPLGAM